MTKILSKCYGKAGQEPLQRFSRSLLAHQRSIAKKVPGESVIKYAGRGGSRFIYTVTQCNKLAYQSGFSSLAESTPFFTRYNKLIH